MILKEIFSGKTYCFTVCNSRKIHLSVIVFVVGVRLEAIIVGVVVVVVVIVVVVIVVVVEVVVIILLLSKRGRFLFGCVCVYVTYLHQEKHNFFRKLFSILSIYIL